MDDKQFANEYYRKYKEDEFSECSTSYAYMTYDILNKRGMIHLSKEQKSVYMDRAAKECEMELLHTQNHISSLLKADVVLSHGSTMTINNKAKELSLMDLFATWKEQGRIRIIQ